MKITCRKAALMLGTSVRRIQQMCQKGEIAGAVKEGKSWLIPESYVASEKKETKPLPVGISDFKKAATDYYYVDKTLLIRDIIDEKPQVALFTRPRRFGKTLTMDMLRVFFEKTKEDNSVYFRDKKIWTCGAKYTSFSGKYPVLFLTFKDVKCATWEETFFMMTKLIGLECRRHGELKNSTALSEFERELYSRFAEERASEVEWQMSLQFLSLFLCKHYRKECVILIDEYDTPVQQGYEKGFYDQVIEFMRNFFSGGFKDNSCLAFGFLTGILKVAKESIFSGLNNIKIYSVLDGKYSRYFGFTEEEVQTTLSVYGAKDKFREVCEWYDGYRFGDSEIFNPWSVINYVADGCTPKAFWKSTGSNDVIGDLIKNSSTEQSENLHALLTGEKVSTYIDTDIVYADIHKNPYAVYSFLLLAGYLKADKVYSQTANGVLCDVAVPNKEIAFIYEKEILSKTGKESIAIAVQQAILKNDVVALQTCLEKFLIESVSAFDGANESFYHGMMLGLCAVVGGRYHIRSNVESGFGRLDIELRPTEKRYPGFVFELKKVVEEKELENAAKKALLQIENKKYDTQMKENGISNVIKVGIAFCGKKTYITEK